MKISKFRFVASVFTGVITLSCSVYGQDWAQIGADIDGAGNDTWLSSSDLSADGSTLVIGESGFTSAGFNSNGRVRVFELNAGTWSQLGNDLLGEATGNGFGMSVRITPDGKTIVCGESRSDVSGHQSGQLRVYVWDGSTWQPKGSWIQGVVDGELGTAADINEGGTRVAVGLPFPNNSNGIDEIARVQVYEWTGSVWTQLGDDMSGDAAGDLFGANISMDRAGNVVAICGRADNSGTGLVRLFEWNGSAWVQRGQDFVGTSAGDYYGTGVSLSADGNSVAIGAAYMDINGTDDGMVQVFDWNGTSWIQRGENLVGVPGDWFGHSVDLNASGNVLAIGAPFSDAFGLDAGLTRVYRWTGVSWVATGSDIGGEAIHDYSGAFDVSLNDDGSYVSILAYGNDDGGSYAGQVRVFSSPSLSVLEKENQHPFLVHPNPAHDVIIIPADVISSDARIEVTNSLGQQLMSEHVMSSPDTEINIADLTPGLYFVSVLDSQGVPHFSSFIKR